MASKVVYLDNMATTPMLPEVVESMIPFFTENFGNPSNLTHAYGRKARAVVESCREEIASLMGASTGDEIIFTSSATESINLAIKGFVAENPIRRVVTSKLEHKAVLESIESIESSFVDKHLVFNDAHGVIDANSIGFNRGDFGSIGWVNNEIGTVQDMQAIATCALENEVVLHSDATQALGKVLVDVKQVPVSMMSASAHKFYGPKGVGILFIRKQFPRIKLRPLLHGGGQEYGLRSSTVNVPGIVGTATALRIQCQSLENNNKRFIELRSLFIDLLRSNEIEFEFNSCESLSSHQIPHVLNLSFTGVQSSLLVSRLSNVACSISSACNTTGTQGSHVLKAIGLDETRLNSSVRFSFGIDTTNSDIEFAIAEIKQVINSFYEYS